MIVIDTAEVQKNIDKLCTVLLPNAVEKGLDAAGLIVSAAAKKNCTKTGMGAYHDGQLHRSIDHEVEDDTCTVGANTEYAAYVHEGTGIYARNGNGRQTPWVYRSADGKYYTTKGQKSIPFLETAVQDNRDGIVEAFENRLGVKNDW